MCNLVKKLHNYKDYIIKITNHSIALMQGTITILSKK